MTTLILTRWAMIAGLFVALAACALAASRPTQANPAPPLVKLTAQVELDAFSGLPNPTWTLSDLRPCRLPRRKRIPSSWAIEV